MDFELSHTTSTQTEEYIDYVQPTINTDTQTDIPHTQEVQVGTHQSTKVCKETQANDTHGYMDRGVQVALTGGILASRFFVRRLVRNLDITTEPDDPKPPDISL
jgi:hypothetical protein